MAVVDQRDHGELLRWLIAVALLGIARRYGRAEAAAVAYDLANRLAVVTS